MSSTPSQIRFFVYENDILQPLSYFSGQELASIDVCVDALSRSFSKKVIFRSETLCVEAAEGNDPTLDDDNEPAYGLLQCRVYDNGTAIPTQFPAEVLEKIIGKSFKVHPQQFGAHPWNENITIKFEI
jgi:hypothetical protein